MPIRINCPQCKIALRMADEFGGKNVRCKACKTVFRVPESIPFVEEVKPDEITAAPPPPKPRKPPLESRRESPAPPPPPPREREVRISEPEVRKARRSVLPWVLGGAFALLLAAGLGAGAVWYLMQNTSTVSVITSRAPTGQPILQANGEQAAAGDAADAAENPPAAAAADIKPAPLKADVVTVQLPGAAGEVCVGGGGRYLIMHLPQQRQLAIFDSNEAKVVKYLPLAEDSPKLAAGLDRMLVFSPNSNVLQRWNLTTFKKEVTVQAPVAIKAMAMGSASSGPLVVLTDNGQNMPGGGGLVCIDPQTLRQSEIRIGNGNNNMMFFMNNNNPRGPTINVSADGRVITGFGTFVRVDNNYASPQGDAQPPPFGNGPPGDCLPSPDGRYLYTTGLHYTVAGRPIGQNVSGHSHMRWYMPAMQGPYYFVLNEVQDGRRRMAISIHLAGDTRELIRLAGCPEVNADLESLLDWRTGQAQRFDKHIFLSPQANLLTVIPAGNDKLTLYRADIDQLLESSGIDYLFVASQPPLEYRTGKSFVYDIAARSKKGGVKYKLESGPDGMTVSPRGRVNWPVPATFAERETTVTITVSDSSGQEILHSFQLRAEAAHIADNKPAEEKAEEKPALAQAPQVQPAPDKIAAPEPRPDFAPPPQPPFRPRERRPPVAAAPLIEDQPPAKRSTKEGDRSAPLVRPLSRTVPIAAAPLQDGKLTIPLPGELRDICVGGGGRFLIMHLPQQRQLGIFDCNQAKIVKYLSVPDDNALFAAGMTKLLVVLPDTNLMQRWDLLSFERELTVPVPVNGKVCSIAMGSASNGPLVLGGPTIHQSGTLPLSFVDVDTLKELQPAEEKGHPAGMVGKHPQYPHTMRVSADGRTITMWNPGLSPMGFQSVVLTGNSLQINSEHNTVGEIYPAPDGRTLYTSMGLYTSELKKIGEQTTRTALRLPSVQGDYSASISVPELIRRRRGANAVEMKLTDLAIYSGRDTRPLVTLNDVEGLDISDRLGVPGRPTAMSFDKRIFLIPAAKLIATVPASRDKLFLKRFDIDEALEKAGIDFLYVTSQPVVAAVKGSTYDYAVAVKSKKGSVTFKLESAPDGMKVSKDGRLTWSVPAAFAEQEASVLLTIGDATGQEIFHNFTISIKNKGDDVGAAAPVVPEQKAPAADNVATPKVKEVKKEDTQAKMDSVREKAAPPEQAKKLDGFKPALPAEKPAIKEAPAVRTDKPAAPAAAVSAVIRPAPLKGDHEERPLPGSVSDVCVGGGGRYLILNIPQQRKLAIFDANEAKVVKYISVGGDGVKIAACIDKLIVLLPGSNVIQRYSLATFEREATVPMPISDTVSQILMGSASHGPLFLVTHSNRPGIQSNSFMNPYTFKVLSNLSAVESGFGAPPDAPWRMSADGNVITSYTPGSSPQGHAIRVRVGNEYKYHGLEGDVAGHMAPGPEGRYVYTARGVFTSNGQPNGKMGSYGDGSRYCLPATEGEVFYLRIDVPGFPHGNDNGPRGKLYIHLTGDDRPLAEIPGVELPRGMNTWGREQFSVDRRFYLIPSAKLLVVLPESQERLLLYRVDIDELLSKSEHDFLVVLSRPPDSVVPGQTLTYTPVVKSRKGAAKCKLEAGPPGMTVSPAGQVSWQVPPKLEAGDTSVILSFSDASGQEVFQTFTLTVRGK
jgi:hypothetical protein